MFYSENLKKFNQIQHCFFSRKNGNSLGIYKSLNCGIGSKDDKDKIKKNLDFVANNFKIKIKQLVLMNQTHSNKVKVIENFNDNLKVDADAMITKIDHLALAVLTADCAPILVYESEKKIIGCIHAGWKGAISGIIENTVEKILEIGGNTKNLVACIGPCIDKKNYEVKKDFYKEFNEKIKDSDPFFLKDKNDLLYFDLRAFIIKKLSNCGILHIDNIRLDSFSMEEEYFSHRRAKKLGENDYGRCISVIKKTIVQN